MCQAPVLGYFHITHTAWVLSEPQQKLFLPFTKFGFTVGKTCTWESFKREPFGISASLRNTEMVKAPRLIFRSQLFPKYNNHSAM